MSQVLTVTIVDGFGLPEGTVYCLGRVVGKDHSTFTTNEKRCSWGVTPAWNEQCDVEEHEPGDALEFLVFSDGLWGRACLQNDDFFPQGFDGKLELQDAPDDGGKLHVRVGFLPRETARHELKDAPSDGGGLHVRVKSPSRASARHDLKGHFATESKSIQITVVSAKLHEAHNQVYCVGEVLGRPMRFQTRPVQHGSDVVWNHQCEADYVVGDVLRFTVVSGMDHIGVVTLESCHFEPYGFDAERTLSSQRRGITGLLRLRVTPLGTSLQPTPAGPASPSCSLTPVMPRSFDVCSRSGGAVCTDNLSLSGRTDPRWMWPDRRAAEGDRYRGHRTMLSPIEAGPTAVAPTLVPSWASPAPGPSRLSLGDVGGDRHVSLASKLVEAAPPLTRPAASFASSAPFGSLDKSPPSFQAAPPVARPAAPFASSAPFGSLDKSPPSFQVAPDSRPVASFASSAPFESLASTSLQGVPDGLSSWKQPSPHYSSAAIGQDELPNVPGIAPASGGANASFSLPNKPPTFSNSESINGSYAEVVSHMTAPSASCIGSFAGSYVQPESQFSIGPEASGRHLDDRTQFQAPGASWNGGSWQASGRHLDDRTQFQAPGASWNGGSWQASGRHLDDRTQFQAPGASWNGGSWQASVRHVDDRVQLQVPGASWNGGSWQAAGSGRTAGLPTESTKSNQSSLFIPTPKKHVIVEPPPTFTTGSLPPSVSMA